MRRRAELVDRTRERITEAAVRLHTTVGPSRASMSAVAKEAGVTRLTLYRHFSSNSDLFDACMGHWRALHPSPDPEPWRQIHGVEERARLALSELYAWYGDNRDDLFPLYRDVAAVPESTQRARALGNSRMADALLHGCVQGGVAGRRLRAAAGHVVAYWTWRSLVVEQGLTTSQAVDLAVTILMAAGAATASIVSSG